MKKLAALLLLLTLLTCPIPSFAQNSPAAASQPPAVNKSAVIKRLLAEIDDGRDLIEKLEKREAALTEEIAKADKAHETLTETYKAALIEIGELRATIKHEKAALAEREEQVKRVTSERDEARKENKSLKRENFLLKLGYVVITIVRAVK